MIKIKNKKKSKYKRTMAELIYAVFLLSGLIKFFLIFLLGGLMVVDFTLLSAVLVTLVYVSQFFRDLTARSQFHLLETSRSLFFALIAFYFWMIVTLLYTRSPGYSYIKILMFLTDVVALAFPLVYRHFQPERFFRWFIYIGTSVIVIYTAFMPNFFATYAKQDESRAFVDKYLDIGYIAGVLILLLLFSAHKMKPMFRWLLLGLNAWALFLSAARGAILFLSLVLFIKAAVMGIHALRRSWRFNLKTVLYGLVGLGGLAGGFAYMLQNSEVFLERTIRRLLLVFDPGSGSVSERLVQIDFCFDKIFASAADFLGGMGIGSFGILYEGVDEKAYPHNMLLEIWFELGAVGLVLFLLLLLVYFKKISRRLNYMLIFIYLMLNSLKSYSLIDNRVMFGILSVLLLCLTHERRVGGAHFLRCANGSAPLNEASSQELTK